MKRLLLVLSVILISGTAFCQIPTSSLVAWYPFCGDTTDHSGNGYTLFVSDTASVSPSLTTDRFGNANTAFSFNGTNNMMRTNTFFSASGDFTYSCWINPTSSQSSTIIYNGKVNANGFGLVMNNGTTNTPGKDVSIQFGGIGSQLSASVTLNQWHQVAFSRNGNDYSLYVDTVLVGSFINYFYPLTSNDVFEVGFDNFTNSSPFNGDIDDIAVYGRQLSHAEIVSLYFFNPDVALFTLGNDTAICTNSVVLSPSPQTPGGNYIWSTGSTATSVTVTPPDLPGTNYWLQISIPYGCTNSDTINVRHLTTTVQIGPRDTVFCASNSVVLNTPRRGETYSWSTGDTTGTLRVSTAGTYWLTVDSLGCFGSDTITIAIKPKPAVDLGPDTSSCGGLAITMQSRDTPYVAPTYVWGGVPVLTAPVTTPSLSTTVTGTYWVTVTDTNGCPGSDTMRILVVHDTLDFNQGDTAICQGGSFQVFGVSIDPGATCQWRPTTGMSVSTIPDPTIVTSVSATYYMTTSYVGCKDTVDSFRLDVQPNPIVGFFGPPRSMCSNDTIHITSSVTPADYTNYIYSWSPSGSLDNPSGTTVVFTAGDSTNLILTISTPHGCVGEDSVQINVHPIGFDSMGAQPPPVCPGDSVQLQAYVSGATFYQGTVATYKWSPSTYLATPDASSTWAYPIVSQNYMVVATSQYGCLDTFYTRINVHPAATIFLGDSVTIYPGDSYHITPQTNCTSFIWSPELGLNDTTISDPTAKPLVSTNYIVHAATSFGCMVEDSIKIHISPNTLIYLPNVFTPGASVNNYFKILQIGAATLDYFRVYNRWGTLVYQSTDITAGWDGTFQGKPQPFDVYVYEAAATNSSGKVFQIQGNVTLLR